jgi:DnaJ-class molecular chaperone
VAIVRKPCPRCKGAGYLTFGDDFDVEHPNLVKDECSRCNGTGFDEFTEGFEEMGVEEE